MTIRKQLTIIISSIILLAVLIYSVISAGYIRRYFNSFAVSEYEQNVEYIKEQAVGIINSDESESRATKTMSVFLSSLIEQISVLNIDGEVIADARETMPMMRSQMMGRQTAEIDYFDIEDAGQKIGTLIIGRTSAIRNSENVVLFGKALATGAIISGAIAFVVSMMIIAFASSKMTKDLRRTAVAAGIADSESLSGQKYSKISEIRAIQQSLENLSSKLGLQKRVRREKADQLSHEVRTPLAILKTNVEGVRDEVIKMDAQRLESCLTEIDHLSEIIGTISDIVEYDKEDIEAEIVVFDLAQLIARINQGFNIQFEKKGIALLYEGADKLRISSDKSLLSQAIYNLISNAYKFTPEGGKTVVALKTTQRLISISVCDSGQGVADEDKERIFEAYSRGAQSDDVPGDGLGLFIAKKNIEALGGTISVKESLFGGACFVIEIPN